MVPSPYYRQPVSDVIVGRTHSIESLITAPSVLPPHAHPIAFTKLIKQDVLVHQKHRVLRTLTDWSAQPWMFSHPRFICLFLDVIQDLPAFMSFDEPDMACPEYLLSDSFIKLLNL